MAKTCFLVITQKLNVHSGWELVHCNLHIYPLQVTPYVTFDLRWPFAFFLKIHIFYARIWTSNVPFHQKSSKHDPCATFTSDVIQGQSFVISITPVRKVVQVYSFVFWIQHGKLHLTIWPIGQGSIFCKCPRFLVEVQGHLRSAVVKVKKLWEHYLKKYKNPIVYGRG